MQSVIWTICNSLKTNENTWLDGIQILGKIDWLN